MRCLTKEGPLSYVHLHKSCSYTRAPAPYMHSMHVRIIFTTIITFISLKYNDYACAYFSPLLGFWPHIDNKETYISLLNDRLTILAAQSTQRKANGGHDQ